MGTHQQFCLRWNNHQSNFLSVFDDLLKHETLVDVTLACEGLSLKAHKVVLSACSPYFQHLFLDNPCKHPIVILKDIKFMDMKTLIDFMYKGEVNVSHDQLSTLLRVADTLKVKGLAEVTENMALQGTEAPAQVAGAIPQTAQPPSQQQHTRPDPSLNSASPPPKRRKKSRKTSGGSNGHSDDVDSGGANNSFGQASAEMRSDVVPKNESSEQNYDSAGLLKSCAVAESAGRSGGLSRSAASASQANISQESASHTHSYTNKNSLEAPQMYESSGGEMDADVPYRSTGMQHLLGRQDESTSSPNAQTHLPSASSSSHADQPEYFTSAADATAPSTSRTSNSQGGRRSSKSGKKKTDTYDSNISDESQQTKHKNRKQHHSSVEIKPHVRTHQRNCIMELIEVASKLIDEAGVTEKTSARASETHLSRNTVNLTRKCQELLNKANKLKAENPAFHFKTTSLQREINDTKDLKQLMSGLGKLKNSLNAAINVKEESSRPERSKSDSRFEEPDKDQVELIKDSGVYLSRHKITACRDAANPQIMVRNLVTACFPMDILLTSTVRGKRKSKEVDFRPALDPVIIDAILEYACQQFNLPRPFADAKLVRAIGQKLIDLRSTKLSYISHPAS